VACFELPEFYGWGANGAVVCHDRLNAENYYSPGAFDDNWSSQTVENECRRTILYYNTYGDSSTFQAPPLPGQDDPVDVYAEIVPFAPSVERSRFDWNGAGSPPYNSTSEPPSAANAWPPVNLAFAHWCNSLDPPAAFWTFSHPFWNAYGQFSENQAVQGFTVYTNVPDCEVTINVLLDSLTAEQSIIVANLALGASDVGIEVWDEGSCLIGDLRPIQLNDAVIVGDRFTKIKSVYDPGNHFSSGWVRSL
jgi:hypothetical protein